MSAHLGTVLIALGLMAIFFGWRLARPSLVLLGAAIALSHGLPLALADPHDGTATAAAFAGEAVLIAGLASLAWLLGYWLLARPVGDLNRPLAAPASDILPVHLAVLLGMSLLICLAPGGPLGFAQAGFLRLPVETALFSLTYAFACLGAFTTLLLCLQRVANGGPPPWLSMAFVLLVFWISGGRVQLAITGLSFALVYLAHGRISLHRLLLPGLALAVLVAQTLAFRLTLQGEETDLLGALPMALRQISLLDGYALSARYVAEAGFHPGQYWDVMQQVVPRALFPEKPLQLSRELRLMEARDGLGGLTPGFAGEAFTAGGLVWLCAASLAFGGALALLDNAYGALGALSPLRQALVVALIPLLAIFVLRCGFDTAIFRFAILVLGGAVLAVGQSGHATRPLRRRA